MEGVNSPRKGMGIPREKGERERCGPGDRVRNSKGLEVMWERDGERERELEKREGARERETEGRRGRLREG